MRVSAGIAGWNFNGMKAYVGPLVRGAIFRRNVCRNNGLITIGNGAMDTLVEHCVVRNADVGIKVSPTA